MRRLLRRPSRQLKSTAPRSQGRQVLTLLSAFVALLVTNLVVAEVKADTVSPERAEALEHMIRHDCGSCHGMTLKGGLGPSLRLSELKDKPMEYVKLTILHGRPGTAMPPWNAILTDAEAEWIAHFLLRGEQEKY